MHFKYQRMLITGNLIRKLIKEHHKYKVRMPVAFLSRKLTALKY